MINLNITSINDCDLDRFYNAMSLLKLEYKMSMFIIIESLKFEFLFVILIISFIKCLQESILAFLNFLYSEKIGC